jgi:TolB protein
MNLLIISSRLFVLGIIFTLSLRASGLAQEEEFTFYQELAWSPDGSRIAYSAMKVSKAGWEKGGYAALEGADYEVYVMKVDGSEVQRLTKNPGYDLWLSWSPDGRSLVFGSDRNGNTDLYVMDDHGGNLKRLTDDPGKESGPSWSPDGKTVAFMSKQNDHWQLWVMNADGSGSRQLTHGAADHHNPVWSPDGEMVVYYANPGGAGRDQVFIMNLKSGEEPRPLVDGVFPAWSPDGYTVIYGEAEKLYIIGIDGSNRRLLAERAEFGRFSPDGRQIAYVMGDFPDTAVYVMNVDGTGQRRLTR